MKQISLILSPTNEWILISSTALRVDVLSCWLAEKTECWETGELTVEMEKFSFTEEILNGKLHFCAVR